MEEINARSINQLLRTDGDINNMIAFIRRNRQGVPDNVVGEANYLEKSNRFIVYRNNLYYVLEDGRRIEYVRNNSINNRLNRLYNDLTESLGKNSRNFYNNVKDNYLNITREQVDEYLKSKPAYNLSRPLKQIKAYSLPTYTKPRAMYNIDLIDMNYFVGYNQRARYIMNVIDVFSKKVMLSALTQKTAEYVANAFQESVIDRGLTPQAITSDNGLEFRGEFAELLEQNNIRQIFNPSAVPVKVVEASNRNVRKFIKDFFIRRRTLRWRDNLALIEDAINNTVSSTTGKTPNYLFEQENQDANNPVFREVSQKVRQQKLRRQPHNEVEFQVDQFVRIALSDAHPDVRLKKKIGELKDITYRWSPDKYRIAQVFRNRNPNAPSLYSIKDGENRLLRNKQGGIMKLKATSILDVSNEIVNNNLTFLQAMTYNRIGNPVELSFA